MDWGWVYRAGGGEGVCRAGNGSVVTGEGVCRFEQGVCRASYIANMY